MILFLDGKVFNSRMDGSTSVDDLLTKVKLLLTSHNTISIASTQEKKVSAASVFYVSDTNLNIYFLSFDKSTHSKNIFKNRNIAATINKDVEDWSDIKGLQIKGYSEKLDIHQREEVLNRYKRKLLTAYGCCPKNIFTIIYSIIASFLSLYYTGIIY